MTDYPRTRNCPVCPFCGQNKSHGLLACWPCFRSKGVKNCEPKAEAFLATFEAVLVSFDKLKGARHVS